MGGRVFAVVVEILVGLILAGVVVGAVVPFFHGAVGPAGAALIGLAIVIAVVVLGEAVRGRKPTAP